MSDIDEYVQKQQEILSEINDIENMSKTTIKQKIIDLKNVTRPLVEAGYYPDKHVGHLCSIIRDKLKSYNLPFIVNKSGWFYDLFDEEERAKDAKMASNISSLPIEKRTGIDVIDRLKEAQRNGQPLDLSLIHI